MNNEIDIAYFRTALIAIHESLEGKKKDAGQSADTVTLDQSSVGRLSRMDALQGQAMSQEAQRRRSVELVRVMQALKRIDEQEFGYCLSCGEEILLARLMIDPAATQCLSCAEASEH